MCLLVIGWRVHAQYPLIVAANRDEFHERAAAPLARWDDPPDLHAGRDLQAGGAWLGVDSRRRIGIVTNFRELARPRRSAPSRGGLIPAFFAGPAGAGEYLERIETDAPGYSGFNLILGDGSELWYASNRADRFARPLEPGIHGLSNHFLDTPWPKLERVRAGFRALLERGAPQIEPLLALLADRTPTAPGESGESGLPPEWERPLSAPFVLNPEYGTRCSTVVLIDSHGTTVIRERRFDPAGDPSGETEFRLNAGYDA